ncbi:MAG: hypothetical protein LUH20_00140 [Lachnospiraceae bacterium]|nr:hypothetical protein [Lachnospiraceae bacterium]
MRNDLLKFEGNAQSLRILSKNSGFNLSESIISALIKYPTMSTQMTGGSVIRHKTGCYYAEKEAFERIAKDVGTDLSKDQSNKKDTNVARHPLAYLVEAADDIAYLTADLEDAVISGLVTVDQLISFFDNTYESLNEALAEKELEKSENTFFHKSYWNSDVEYETIHYTKECIEKLRTLESKEHEAAKNRNEDTAKVINTWMNFMRTWLMYVASYTFSVHYKEIMAGTYQHDLFYHNYHSLTVELLRKAMLKFVYDTPSIVETELSAQSIINFLLDKFIPATVHLKNDLSYGKDMTVQEKKVIKLIPAGYQNDYLTYYEAYLNNKACDKDQISDNDPYLVYRRILIATDFISGMTDGFAQSLYRKMTGME